jgi:hypothetical protein
LLRKTLYKAFTLTRLTLAVSITAVIGLAVGSMSTTLVHAHSHSDVMRESIQSARLAMMKLEVMLRAAKLVTCAGGSRLVIWTGDANDDGRINVGELVLVRYDAGAEKVEYWRVVFPETMSQGLRKALNRTLTLNEATDAGLVAEALGAGGLAGYLARPALASSVTGFEMAADAPPPRSRLLALRVAAGPPDQHITLSNAVRLRADATEYVDNVDGQWVLDLP